MVEREEMAAYGSLTCLKHTIHRLRNSSQISFVPPSPQIIESVNDELQSLRKTLLRLERISPKKINALEEQIRDAMYKLEDVFEFQFSDQILSQSEEDIGRQFSIDLQESEHEINSLVETLKEMEQQFIQLLDNPNFLEEEEDDGDGDGEDDELVSSSKVLSCGNESKMVGFSDKFVEIKDRFKRLGGNHIVTPITGMAGIGKTKLATAIFNDFDISECFDFRAWVTVGRKWRLREILLAILAQVDSEMIMDEEVENIGDYLREILKGKRYLIVFDDVWDEQLWKKLNTLFKENDYYGGKIMITTRLDRVGRSASNPVAGIVKMRLLNKEESWDLLREKVFGDELCPFKLEKFGKKIAEKCDGLPLMIVAVGRLLSQEERKPEYWNEVAEKRNSVFMDAYGEISKALYPSYKYLPLRLKTFFPFMGVFPQNHVISKSKLVTLWAVEGFPEPLRSQTPNHYSEHLLRELIYHNVVMFYCHSTVWDMQSTGVKTCGVHTSMWHLCNREAKKSKFLHILDRFGDDLEDCIEGQRRLSVLNNTLFAIKDVHELIEDKCGLSARSLLCFGPYSRYQVPVCFGLRLLKVLDALTIRFYEFPSEVVKLVQLRYLGLTCDGNVPSFISKLWNLEFLIVHRHLIIKTFEVPSYMPMEIWDMKELKHLQIVGSDLQDPCGASLPNLSTLLDVSALSCKEAIFEAIPNLRKLGIQIDTEPNTAEPLNISNLLKKLRILKCVVVNPEIMSPPSPLPPSFPLFLRKLHLSGLGYPWEYMSSIECLPHVTILKLRCYAFQGPKWVVEENKFPNLRYLEIEDTDLEEWEVKEGGFSSLYSISIKHCHLLEKIEAKFGVYFNKWEVVDSNPSVVNCLKQITDAHSHGEFHDPIIHVHSSWDDGKLK